MVPAMDGGIVNALPNSGYSLDLIMSTVGWRRASTFGTFYVMPVSSPGAFGAGVLVIIHPVCCHLSGGVMV